MALLPTAARAQTHLNVPAKQVLSMSWIGTGLDTQNTNTGTWSGLQALNSDWSWVNSTAPVGYAIVLTEIHISAPLVSTSSPVVVRVEPWNSNWTKVLESIDHTIFIPANTGYYYKTTWKLDTGMVLSAGTHARMTVLQTGSATPSNFGLSGSGYYTTY